MINSVKPSNGNKKLSLNYNFNYKENLRLFISKKNSNTKFEISSFLFRPNKKQEPSETGSTKNFQSNFSISFVLDIALIKSEKSVRELKLALGRLVNFIQTSSTKLLLFLSNIRIYFRN